MYLCVSYGFLDKQHQPLGFRNGNTGYLLWHSNWYFDTYNFQASKHRDMKFFTMCGQLCNAFHTHSYHSQATSCQLPQDKIATSTTNQISTANKAVAAK